MESSIMSFRHLLRWGKVEGIRFHWVRLNLKAPRRLHPISPLDLFESPHLLVLRRQLVAKERLCQEKSTKYSKRITPQRDLQVWWRRRDINKH